MRRLGPRRSHQLYRLRLPAVGSEAVQNPTGRSKQAFPAARNDDRHLGRGHVAVGRGRAQSSIEIIDAAIQVVETCRPITVRGIAYKLFAQGFIKSMAFSEYRKVQRLVLEAREAGVIDWEHVVDDGRPTQRPSVFESPRSFADAAESSWRADPWQEQDVRVEIISEKATVAGVLAPVLRELALPFRPFKGFTSGTAAHRLAEDSIWGDGDSPLVCLYLGDHDPSGRFMSDVDLPERIERYGGHVRLFRIALTEADLPGLPSFDVSTKQGDTRTPWFRKNFGTKCVELDAMDPEALRDRVRDEVQDFIDTESWDCVETANKAVANSLAAVMKGWSKKATSIFERVQK